MLTLRAVFAETMLYENGTLDATLAAAAGEDPALLAELRGAFAESLERQIDLLKRARCDGNWDMAALRLKGLAASFHASELQKLAAEAIDSAPGEPTVIRKIDAFYQDFIANRA
jgi:HPt (histidine-containing phosphotransfer) domain-containing protein